MIFRSNTPPLAGKLADVADLWRPDFGASFRNRFDDAAACLVPRKRWELCWLAQAFDDIHGTARPASILGLGVGQEPLIHHFAHLCDHVVATDLYDEQGAWKDSRIAANRIAAANLFPYPRQRLTVRNMDMRQIDFPAESFDAVWSCSSVEHVATLGEFRRIFEEVHRVLKPGGHALITTEFSLDEPYFLPGVLSLWHGAALFQEPMQGLALAGAVDLAHNTALPGNRATPRRDTHRLGLMNDLKTGPAGMCTHVGYTRLTPVAFVLRKTGPRFGWPDLLGAPAWYGELSTAVELFGRKEHAAAASRCQAALGLARTPGARLHCFRHLVDAQINAGHLDALQTTLHAFAEEMADLPDDDDALDLIAYVASRRDMQPLAHRCWERAGHSQSALPASRLRIRFNQLEAELAARGQTTEARHLNVLIESAWIEALDFHGADDPYLLGFQDRLAALRAEHGLAGAGAPAVAGVAAAPPAPAVRVSPQRPHFDLTAPPQRPMVYLGDHVALTRTVYGHKMYVDTRSQSGACYLMDGYWEEWIARRLKDYVEPGMHAVDIGANMGFYTMMLCDLVGPGGRVTAFEPWPAYYDLLCRNVEVNGFRQRATTLNMAVHAGTAEKELFFSSNHGTGSMAAGLTSFIRNQGYQPVPNLISVKTTSLDEYLADHPEPVDFIKIDVDGSESFVIDGMHKLVEGSRPLTVFCEFTPYILRESGLDPQAFLDKLRRTSFTISQITPTGISEVGSIEGIADDAWIELLLVRR